MRESKLICSRNKHGFRGVRKRGGDLGKPYYARIKIDNIPFYSPNYVTAEEAGAAYDGMAVMIAGTRVRPVDNVDSADPAE